ncbi:membrane-associating domain-domain-containing protein [Coniella lustricola]|uniref:Membrane-associating domain-domain-containing protein n=1 Tax=Coniella lustricola TaxID=2025994 RepID=A0A2T2ZUS1_9PEZI|nr:membrane-associating domain-domain-containing protein [Coniella lustricola]
MLSIVSIIFRALQMLFAIVVVGLSATFMKDQHVGSVPVTTRYSVFVGAFGMIIGSLGLVALWLDGIPSIIPMAADAIAALLFLAGGIAWAVGMKGQSCTEASLKKLYDNALLNQGCNSNLSPNNYGPYCYIAGDQSEEGWPLTNLWPSPMKGVCQKAFSNESFLFLGFGAAVILVGLGFLMMKRKGNSRSKFVA